ncbi:winged helix-turn-helix domain-containing protein [Janibacter sp. GXQ6167]|uniref:winged helix-turn-helix domain-containing protein n=1 Tax=Janibacter sp. GXQ6167 TaxID=3240791 RepID=UPI0035263B5D
MRRAAAARIAIAAQGLAGPRPLGPVTMRQIARVIATVGIVQIDSVNVLARSHYLPFYSRLGPHDRGLVDRARDEAPRRLVEYWGHEAALVPPTTWPLFDHRMRRADAESWGGMRRVATEHPALVEAVREEVVSRGPLTARQVEAALAHDRPIERTQWGWNWSLVKCALEHLFWGGQISSAGRTAQFERRYASLARVVPPADAGLWLERERPSEAEACRELVRIAARAHGIATEADLADYFRLKRIQAAPAIASLVDAGELVPVQVEGWGRAYLHPEARRPRSTNARALLSPFDSMVWTRQRLQDLFGFRYRIEIYTPAAKRVHGYYVLPFLLGEDFVGRVDLKADRGAGRLLVQQVTWEPGRGGSTDRAALDAELHELATHLGLT